MGEPVPLILADARSVTERRLVREWVDEHHPAAEIVHVVEGRDAGHPEDADLRAVLNQVDSRELLPVRVTWLPRERPGSAPLALGEMLLLGRPRRPWRPVQEVITRTRSDGVVISEAEPGTVGDLRERFIDRYGPVEDDAALGRFAAFVVRQAMLAMDRADRATLGNRYKVPRLMVEQMIDDPGFGDGVTELAGRLDRDPSSVRDDVRRALAELVAVQSQLAIDLWRTLVRPLHKRAWKVDASASKLSELREINRTHSLVFLFSHRSYVDPLILADVLLEHDLPRNHTIGGANLSFWPFGPIGKRAGMIFIRRSFGDDEPYKFAVRRYLAHLMKKRFNLEWSIEGGRTRTGKLRRPKYGILRYLVDSLEVAAEADPIIVPVSLVYEQLHEVRALAAEETGGTKKPESLSWFAGYVRAQQQNLGDVLVRFGEPLGLRQALEDAGESARLEKVAFEVCTRINDVTPATSTSLVSLVLLGERDRALTLEQVARRITPILDHLDYRGIERPKEDLRTDVGLRAVLDRMSEAGVVDAYDGGTTTVWSVQPDRHHTAAFYRNGALHHLLNRAIAELSVLQVGTEPRTDGRTPDEEFHKAALTLRDLLKFEFFFPDKQRFAEEMSKELARLGPDWGPDWDGLDGDSRTAVRRLHAAVTDSDGPPLLLAHHVLRSFVGAQRIAAEALVAVGGGASVTHDELTTRGLALGEQLIRQRLVHGSESLSRELLGGAALLADNRGLLQQSSTAQASREAWRDQLATVRDHLDRIADLEERLREGTPEERVREGTFGDA